MPKAAPDQVIIHRIEFQETERELLKTAMTAYSFRNATKGIFNLTSDVTTVVLILIALEAITGDEWLGPTIEASIGVGGSLAQGLVEQWKFYRSTQEYQEGYDERASSVGGGLWNLIQNLINGLVLSEEQVNLG